MAASKDLGSRDMAVCKAGWVCHFQHFNQFNPFISRTKAPPMGLGRPGRKKPGCAQIETGVLGSVKKKVAPRPGSDSAHRRPPCRLITRLTVASPTPVPGNSDTACK